MVNSTAPLISNGWSAVANTAAVFALSTAAGPDFPRFAASTAALILAYGTARSLLGEPLMLTRRDRETGGADKFPSIGGWVVLSLGLGGALGSVAALGLGAAGVEGVGWITFVAVIALIFNDSCRHLCFARGSSWTAAAADMGVAAVTLVVWSAASSAEPSQVYWIWAIASLMAAAAMLTTVVRRGASNSTKSLDAPVRTWVRDSWSTTRWLGAEAVAVTAAVTVPLILAADSVAAPGRLLLSWFGFQQILFFAAYAVASRSGSDTTRTTIGLFGTGALAAVVLGVVVSLVPTELLVAAFGSSAEEAKGWALWFAGLQILVAAGNALALAARLWARRYESISTALFQGRLLSAIVSTIAGVAGALALGVGGYIGGAVIGAALHVFVSVLILRRSLRSSPLGLGASDLDPPVLIGSER